MPKPQIYSDDTICTRLDKDHLKKFNKKMSENGVRKSELARHLISKQLDIEPD